MAKCKALTGLAAKGLISAICHSIYGYSAGVGYIFNNDRWTVQVGVGHKTENEMYNVNVHNVMFIMFIGSRQTRKPGVLKSPCVCIP